jgi:hypothetical protein
VGEDAFNYENLILKIIKHTLNRNINALPLLHETISMLLFHNSTAVRKQMVAIFVHDSTTLRVVLSHVQRSLQYFGFQAKVPAHLSQADNLCRWVEVQCIVGSIPGHMVLGVPCLKCTEAKLFGACEGFTQASEESLYDSRRLSSGKLHSQNFDRLLELTHIKKENVLQILAVQNDPFPYVVTEGIVGHRLLDYILLHRTQVQRLTIKAMLQLFLKIVDIIVFLRKHNFVQRDLTAFNLKVSPEEDVPNSGRGRSSNRTTDRLEVLPSGLYKLKLIDVALLHRNADDQGIPRNVEGEMLV